jgi:hypothetical protein
MHLGPHLLYMINRDLPNTMLQILTFFISNSIWCNWEVSKVNGGKMKCKWVSQLQDNFQLGHLKCIAFSINVLAGGRYKNRVTTGLGLTQQSSQQQDCEDVEMVCETHFTCRILHSQS